MSIKYEILPIKNAKGMGFLHLFAHLHLHESITEDQLLSRIEESCSLTKGDVKASYSATQELLINEVAAGKHFHLPGIGTFSLSVKINNPKGKPAEKIRGNDIQVRTILFRPDASLLHHITQRVSFERANFSSLSHEYEEADILSLILDYLSTHNYINRRSLQELCHLRPTMARKWLRHFTTLGTLRKEGLPNAPIYFLNSLEAEEEPNSFPSPTSLYPQP